MAGVLLRIIIIWTKHMHYCTQTFFLFFFLSLCFLFSLRNQELNSLPQGTVERSRLALRHGQLVPKR